MAQEDFLNEYIERQMVAHELEGLTNYDRFKHASIAILELVASAESRYGRLEVPLSDAHGLIGSFTVAVDPQDFRDFEGPWLGVKLQKDATVIEVGIFGSGVDNWNNLAKSYTGGIYFREARKQFQNTTSIITAKAFDVEGITHKNEHAKAGLTAIVAAYDQMVNRNRSASA